MLGRSLNLFRRLVRRTSVDPVELDELVTDESTIHAPGVSVEYSMPERSFGASASEVVSELQVMLWVSLCEDPSILRKLSRMAAVRADQLSGPAIVFKEYVD